MTDVFPAPIRSHPRAPTGDAWIRRQTEAALRQPGLALRRGSVFIGFAPLGYRLAVEGDELHPALAPPRVAVGGVIVRELQFAADGLTLRGRLPRRPPDLHLVIDYGFARAELDLSRKTGWWYWLRPLLLQAWSWVDELVRKLLSFLP